MLDLDLGKICKRFAKATLEGFAMAAGPIPDSRIPLNVWEAQRLARADRPTLVFADTLNPREASEAAGMAHLGCLLRHQLEDGRIVFCDTAMKATHTIGDWNPHLMFSRMTGYGYAVPADTVCAIFPRLDRTRKGSAPLPPAA